MPLLSSVFIPTLLLFQLACSVEDPAPQITENPQNQDPVLSLLERHEAQLNRLESQIESLSKLVNTLEKSSLSNVQLQQSVASMQSLPQTSQAPFFSTKFTFSAISRLDSDPTCAAALPFVDTSGSTTYFAAGGQHGNTYIISVRGDVALNIPAVSKSEVTSILSYLLPVKRNETLIYTGHKDGSVAVHRVIESNSGVGWMRLELVESRPFVRGSRDLDSPPVMLLELHMSRRVRYVVAADGSVAVHRVIESNSGAGWMRLELVESRPFVRGSRDLDSPPVMLLELHMSRRVRYVVAADGGGRIRVFTESGGTLYGTVIASGKVLAFMKQRLLFLTERGAGSLDLRSMMVKETECEGLNGSIAQTYTFDRSEPTKAYGFTSSGDLIHIVLLGEAGNLKCRVRSIRKSEINPEPVSIQSIRGYLLAATVQKVHIYNISSQYYGRVGAPRPLFFSTLQEIIPDNNGETASVPVPVPALTKPNPLIATDREKLVLLGLGGGYIGIFRSRLPVYKAVSSHVFWSVPLLLFLLFLIGLWQFYVKKKDSLGWTSDETFSTTSSSSTAAAAAAATERVYGDVSDVREMRGGGLRGPPRRYVSPPSTYPAGPAIPFRSAASGADLKYRGGGSGSSLETPPGFPPRREQLYSSNAAAVDQHID